MRKIGIDINGVLRDTVGKFTQLYEKHLIESSDEQFLGRTYDLDMSGNTEVIDVEVDTFKYEQISDVDSLELSKHFSFRSEEEFFSFMYEDYTMELFGHSPSTEMTTFNTLNDLYYDLRDENDLLIVSSEIGKSKPASLFFLSKFGCLLEKVVFFSQITKNSMWNEVDILLTADPTLLLEKPVDKIVVKFNTNYNKHIKCDFEISSLSEFGEIIKTLK
jgi:hypothetical protein